MPVIALNSEVDFEAWRGAARSLVLHGVPPEDVGWSVAGEAGDMAFWRAPMPPPRDAQFSMPRAFVDLAATAFLNRNGERFALLYRLLWRLRREPHLLDVAIDPLVARVSAMAKAVKRDEHKMHAFVRFRAIATDEGERFVAWFEPSHHIVERATPFFVRRFAAMRWSILTPERAAHWDGSKLAFGPGLTRNTAPADDALEELWRSYYAAIFNPARLKVGALPKRYWRNLPEARLIRGMIAKAQRATDGMMEAAPTAPARRLQRWSEA